MIVMPAMLGPQAASWHGLMDLHERLDHGWTLVGGQLVHLHWADSGGHRNRMSPISSIGFLNASSPSQSTVGV